MEVKKGYKQTEVGIIPYDWEVKEIENFASVSSGGTPNRKNPSFWSGNIPWITTSQIDFKIITEASEFITEEGLNNSAAKIYKAGTILIAMYGQGKTRGKIAVLGIDASINQACAAVSLQNVVKEYVFHNLSGRYKELRSLSNTGNQENLNGALIKKILVPFPPNKKEQLAIVAVLSDSDNLIANLGKLIAKKEGIKKGTMQTLLTGKKRLLGFNERWKTKKINKLFKFLSTANNSRSELSDEGEIGYIHYGDIHTKWSEFLDASKETIPFIKKEKIKDVPFLENGDLLIADASEDYQGLCSCIELKNVNHRKIVAGLHTLLLRGKKEEIANGFKGYLPHLKGFKEAVIRAATGISVYGISKKNLGEIEIIIPDFDEQLAIASVIDDMTTEIKQLEEKLQKYRMIKQSLMQQLLTGKIRLV